MKSYNFNFTLVMDTVSGVIGVVEFAEWCLHCGSTLVECIFRILLQVLFTLALFALYCGLVLQ